MAWESRLLQDDTYIGHSVQKSHIKKDARRIL
jgi:hypothetical protein